MLLYMKAHVLHALSSEIAYGLHELLRTDATNIHKSEDWFILFSLLEVAGAAISPPAVLQSNSSSNLPLNKHLHLSQSNNNVESDSECSDCVTSSPTDKGYTSDSEIYRRSGYIVVSHDDLENKPNEKFPRHDRRALSKSCEILSFLIRDVAYITSENFEYYIHCIRIFIEATIKEQTEKQKSKLNSSSPNARTLNRIRKATSATSLNNESLYESSNTSFKQTRSDYRDDEDMEDSIKEEYQTLALQLLDLMHTLHVRAAQTYKPTPGDQTFSSLLWYKCWCPILQGEFVAFKFVSNGLFRYCSSLL